MTTTSIMEYLEQEIPTAPPDGSLNSSASQDIRRIVRILDTLEEGDDLKEDLAMLTAVCDDYDVCVDQEDMDSA